MKARRFNRTRSAGKSSPRSPESSRLVLWTVAPLTAHAAVNCVVSPGVTQTDTVVTGSPGNGGNDTITGGLGIDTISGSAGNDTLAGASNDGSQDSLNGGDGIDTCQGPAPDPDIHASHENTTTPQPRARARARQTQPSCAPRPAACCPSP
jgi:hypothetical protein